MNTVDVHITFPSNRPGRDNHNSYQLPGTMAEHIAIRDPFHSLAGMYPHCGTVRTAASAARQLRELNALGDYIIRHRVDLGYWEDGFWTPIDGD